MDAAVAKHGRELNNFLWLVLCAFSLLLWFCFIVRMNGLFLFCEFFRLFSSKGGNDMICFFFSQLWPRPAMKK